MGVFRYLDQTIVYFSKILGTPIYNEDGILLGKLTDLFVDYEEIYPVVLAIQICQSKQFFYIEWDQIKYFSASKITVKTDSIKRKSRTYPKVFNKKILTSLLANNFSEKTADYPPIGKVILDRQIVDTFGKKVVRVNDIHFIKVGQSLRVTHAAVGLRSLLRRLNFDRFIDPLIRLIRPKAKYLSNEPLIPWKFVHAIPDKSVHSNVKLNLANEELSALHPADLADILEELDNYGREHIFKNLNPDIAAETLSEVDADKQIHFIRYGEPKQVAKIIEKMGTDEAADLLSDLSVEKAGKIIAQIKDKEQGEEIQELLEYDEDTAGGIMSTEASVVSPNTKKQDILHMIQTMHNEFESIYNIYVVDENHRLLGECSLKDILIQEKDIEISEYMNVGDIKYVGPDLSWKDVAQHMSKYNLINTPVVDEHLELLGIISVDDILPWLLNERQ